MIQRFFALAPFLQHLRRHRVQLVDLAGLIGAHRQLQAVTVGVKEADGFEVNCKKVSSETNNSFA